MKIAAWHFYDQTINVHSKRLYCELRQNNLVVSLCRYGENSLGKAEVNLAGEIDRIDSALIDQDAFLV
ncbi:MAG: hypothetical protein EB038_10455 [Cyclobacteriaceae bacterium]|nr:hypothetical protein [Cyclobacteriaceae bacterium]